MDDPARGRHWVDSKDNCVLLQTVKQCDQRGSAYRPLDAYQVFPRGVIPEDELSGSVSDINKPQSNRWIRARYRGISNRAGSLPWLARIADCPFSDMLVVNLFN
jgi:hypothetical protein